MGQDLTRRLDQEVIETSRVGSGSRADPRGSTGPVNSPEKSYSKFLPKSDTLVTHHTRHLFYSWALG